MRFLTAVQSQDNIKLIGEHAEHTYTSILEKAEEIIIIGFSFDRANLNTLGFKNDLKQHGKFLADKELKYMDYKGQMNSLYNQFSEIQKKHKNILITRSPADRIISAYQNDFKIYLYK